MIYFLLIFYTVFVAYIFKRNYIEKANKLTIYSIKRSFCFFIMVIPAIIISGLRYGISVDYIKVYERSFYLILNNKKNISGFETGFYWLVKLCSKIIAKPWFMFTVVAAITIILYFKAFEESKEFLVSVFLFFAVGAYFDSFNGIRQYIVVAVFMYAYRYIRTNNLKKYILIMGLCILIHNSAIFTIPLYFLSKIRINKIYAIIVCVGILLLQNKILYAFVLIISKIPKYNEYLLRNTLQDQISFSLSGLVMAIIALIPCFLCVKQMQKTNEGRFLYNMMLLGLLLAACTSFFPFAERIMYYTRSYIIFSVPFACGYIKKYKNVVEYLVLGLYAGLTTIGIIFLNWYAVLPYKFVLF